MVTFLLKQSIYSQSKDTLKVQSDYNIIHYFKQKKRMKMFVVISIVITGN